jgi:hypothetical protein
MFLRGRSVLLSIIVHVHMQPRSCPRDISLGLYVIWSYSPSHRSPVHLQLVRPKARKDFGV